MPTVTFKGYEDDRPTPPGFQAEAGGLLFPVGTELAVPKDANFDAVQADIDSHQDGDEAPADQGGPGGTADTTPAATA
jgi:hypothetical protein